MKPIIPISLMLLGCAAHEAPMPVSQHLGVTGLFTDPSPHTDVPDGAMDAAQEVCFRRKGTVEPRPGFKLGTAVTLDDIWKLIPFDADMLHIGTADGGSPTYNTRWSNDTGVRDESSAALAWTRQQTRAAVARKNLYLTTTDATRRLSDNADTTAYRAGLEPPWIEFMDDGSAGTAVANGSKAAYRATLELHLSNGHIIVSPPSGRVVYDNNSGATQDPDGSFGVRIPTVSGAKAYIKLYRSKTTTSATASDEMFLVDQIDYSASTGLQTGLLTDRVADADLGEKLYTNPTREGIERANQRPPVAADLALYKGSLFFTRLTLQARKTLSYLEGGSRTASATGIGTRTYNGTRTNGSPTITGLSSVVGLQVGMLLTSATNWSTSPAAPRVTAIVGADVTVNATWTGATDGAPVAIGFADSFNIGSNYYRADQLRTLIGDYNEGETTSFLVSTRDTSTTQGTTPVNAKRAFAIEAVLATTTLSIRATHGDEYEPPIPLVTATAESVAPQSIANGYAWSKTDQPDHYLLGALQYAGKETVAIVRAIPTTEALWFLKGLGDGIYRLAGEGERSGWRLDQFDSSVYLLHPELACAFGDTVYAWTNVGAVAINSSGVVRLSEPAIGNLTHDLQVNLDHLAVKGGFCVANEKDNEIIWGVPNADLGDSGHGVERIFVLNTKTRAWSQWFADDENYTAVAYAIARDLWFGKTTDAQPRIERLPAEIVHWADQQYSPTINTITAATRTVVIAAGSGWTPAVGDLLVRGGIYCIVTSINSATSFVVHDVTGLTTGAATSYVAFESYIRWLNESEDAPSHVKNFQKLITHWEDTTGIYTWDVEMETPASIDDPTELSYTRTYDHSSDRDVPDDHEAYAQRRESRANRIYPALRIKQADAQWRVSGLTLEFEPIDTGQQGQR